MGGGDECERSRMMKKMIMMKSRWMIEKVMMGSVKEGGEGLEVGIEIERRGVSLLVMIDCRAGGRGKKEIPVSEGKP